MDQVGVKAPFNAQENIKWMRLMWCELIRTWNDGVFHQICLTWKTYKNNVLSSAVIRDVDFLWIWESLQHLHRWKGSERSHCSKELIDWERWWDFRSDCNRSQTRCKHFVCPFSGVEEDKEKWRGTKSFCVPRCCCCCWLVVKKTKIPKDTKVGIYDLIGRRTLSDDVLALSSVILQTGLHDVI